MLFSCLFAKDILVNYIGFAIVIVVLILPSGFKIYDSEIVSKQELIWKILLSEIDTEIEVEVTKYLEGHKMECENLDCLCQELPMFENEQ